MERVAVYLLVVAHYEEETAADFREFFHCSRFSVGTAALPFEEFVLLMAELISNPETRLHASLRGMKYRVPRWAYILMDIFDLMVLGIFEPGKRQFYKRPLDAESSTDNDLVKRKKPKKAPTVGKMATATLAPMTASKL